MKVQAGINKCLDIEEKVAWVIKKKPVHDMKMNIEWEIREYYMA
jgi:GH43 family beta-xylosidase